MIEVVKHGKNQKSNKITTMCDECGCVFSFVDKGMQDWGDPYTIEDFKPYLRPMDSMTKEEVDEFFDITIEKKSQNYGDDTDWLNKKCFDYRGLIPKGLALEAPDNMYNN